MNLSEHFILEELVHSDTAVRLGIDNTPPADVVPHLVVLATGLEQIRRVTGHPLVVHSGYRCEELERVLSKKDFEAWCFKHQKNISSLELLEAAWQEYFQRKGHPKGYCGDFICPAFGAPVEIVKVVKASGIKFDQLIEEGTWVHASFDPRMRGEILTARFDATGKPTYMPGIA